VTRRPIPIPVSLKATSSLPADTYDHIKNPHQIPDSEGHLYFPRNTGGLFFGPHIRRSHGSRLFYPRRLSHQRWLRYNWQRSSPLRLPRGSPEGLRCVSSLCASSRIINSPCREDNQTAIMDDSTIYGVVHNDVTAFNFLRFTGDTPQARCLRHNIVHGWRVMDSHRSLKVDMENGTTQAKEDPAIYSSVSPASFWGKCKYLSFEFTTNLPLHITSVLGH